MSESESKLDFSLPGRTGNRPERSSRPNLSNWILAVVLVLVALNLLLVFYDPRLPGAAPQPGAGALSAEALKQLALKIEQQGLNRESARAWEEYLGAAQPAPPEAAKIWYRIGKLHQDAEAYEAALAAFYRSESIHPDDELANEIGRRIRESLEALGKFAALKHELADRVGLNEDAAGSGGQIVAEIGSHKISRAEIDRQIEAEIENQLAMFGGQLPDDERLRHKEELLKQHSGSREMLQFVNLYIVQEILYRKARDSKLMEDPGVRAQLRDAERSLLARKMMEREMADQVKITANDVNLYYRANLAKYKAPERAKISWKLAKDEDEAKKLIEAGNLGDGAKDLEDWVSKGGPIPDLGASDQAHAAIFSTAAGQLAAEPVKTDQGFCVIRVREREPERQQSFEEVQRQVWMEYRQQKEREVQQKLLDRLRDDYDVVIHQDAFQPAAEQAK
jgi:parvulin-like peptidyl-prolyl isomerase